MQRINLQQIQSFEQFYRIPKIFFTSEKYKDMRLESKTAYAILRDRFELSLKNGWVDEQQNVYFVFTVAALQEILGCGKNKVIAIKKDLAKYGLLEEEKMGFNRANRLYIGAVTNDSFSENSLEPLGDKEVSKSNLRKFEKQTTGGLKNKPPKVSKSNPNDTDYSDTELSDTKPNEKRDDDDDVLTQSAESESQKEKLLIDQYRKETGGSITQVKIQRLSELAKYHGPLIVSEAITKAALNDSSNLFYIEQVIDTLEQEKQQWQKTLSEQSTQSKEIAPKVPMFRFDKL
ncbi:replication initiator protein A [Fructobacillus tropaeoli]|uniref:replication initiator protein A n=1 Tax=Fructobacillus tropaeoli TaxID=709323 RepID=UPI001941BC6A|nr:replication initiator protein A [Fructobacillus tropaeoli]GIC69425.1 replication initiator protein A [Fructobacillus tropaeoli]